MGAFSVHLVEKLLDSVLVKILRFSVELDLARPEAAVVVQVNRVRCRREWIGIVVALEALLF